MIHRRTFPFVDPSDRIRRKGAPEFGVSTACGAPPRQSDAKVVTPQIRGWAKRCGIAFCPECWPTEDK